MHQCEIVMYGRTLTYEERYHLTDYFFDRIADGYEKYGSFVGHQFLHVHDHPNFSSNAPIGAEAVDIIQD